MCVCGGVFLKKMETETKTRTYVVMIGAQRFSFTVLPNVHPIRETVNDHQLERPLLTVFQM